ncbi:MAG: hypothetical protein JO149_00185, partial [Gammaproteobacteria bacterium]|nr:hypothetical protein [Gammaproteobacteria bacterium]
VMADVPTFAVFGATGNVTVAAYNGSLLPRDIHFFTQNGQNLCVLKNVQPGAMQTQVC